MITDSETNFIYLADSLPKTYPTFFDSFKSVLTSCNIPFSLLPNTKDIWAVDYMPVQITTIGFVQFLYDPDYLQPKKYRKTISNADSICEAIKLQPQKTDIRVDGGNVIRTSDKMIMCDKVFKENPTLDEKQLIKRLKELFQVDRLYFIPTDPLDFTGHADGMVRFLDSDTVLINDYSRENSAWQRTFRMALHNAGLDYFEIPYNPDDNTKDHHANGIYINYLETEQAIILPTYNKKEDDEAVKLFEQLFKGRIIRTVDGNEIAYEGGVLNCITWNIRT